MNIAYVRVSTVEQNEERQLKALEQYNIDRWYIEKVSGKNTDRPQLQAMLQAVRQGDKVYIKDFSRLARSTKDLLEIIEKLNQEDVSLISLNENLDTSTPTGKLLVTMIGAINEFERNNLLERQKEGIEIAKEKGVYKGRQEVKLNNKIFKALYDDMQKGYITKVDMAKKLNISRATLYKKIKDYEKTL